MSSEIPPSPITTGFNESAWIQPPLTNALANRNYLLKIRPDTANVVETFTAGIKTNTINAVSDTGIVAIGNSLSNNIEVGASLARSTILHIGDGDNSSGNINIGNGANNTGNIQILNGTYTAGIAAGSVNILNGTHDATTTGGNVLIHRGNANGEFNVGNSLSTINLNAGTTNVTNLTTVNPITTSYTAIPNATNQLGFRLFSAGTVTAFPTSAANLNSVTVGSGVWMITAECRVPNVAATYTFSISETSNTHQNGLANFVLLGTTANAQEFVINAVASTTSDPKIYYLVGSATATGTTATHYMYATKIA
jgi:hypothetical protein